MQKSKDDYLTKFEKFYLYTLTSEFEKCPIEKFPSLNKKQRLRSNSCHFLNIRSHTKKQEKSRQISILFKKRLKKVKKLKIHFKGCRTLEPTRM